MADTLTWSDYLEVAILVLACLVGLVGNMAVLRASLRIRAFSRQISLLFSGIVCADVLVCGTRIPTTVYLIFSPLSEGEARSEGGDVTATSLTSDPDSANSSAGMGSMEGSPVMGEDGGGGGGMMVGHASGGAGVSGGGMNNDLACEVWAASSALMLTVVWLHLAAVLQRIAIIFTFSAYRRHFTPTAAGLVVLAAWVGGSILVYTPLRVLGLTVDRAGRGACRADDATPEHLLAACSALTALLCLLPLLVTTACYLIVVRSVWQARGVRTQSAAHFDRLIYVTLLRMLSLALTYLPLSLVLIAEVRPGFVAAEAVWRYAGHLLWMQSVLSPWVSLQDNDFRDRMLLPTKHVAAPPTAAQNGQEPRGEGCGEEGGGGVDAVMPDIGSSGGQDDDEHRARNLREMNREMRKSQLKRGLSFISSADMRTIRGSSE